MSTNNVVSELLAQTDGSAMDRERLSSCVRDVLLNTPLQQDTEARTQEPTPWKCGNIQLPKFIGYEDRQSPTDFLDKFENFCLVTGVPDSKRVRQVLPAALEGTAKLWWRFAGGFEDWETFVKEFHAEFASVDYKHRLKEELDRRTQHPQENLRHFIHVIAEFYDRIGETVSDEEKVRRVRRQMHPKFQDLCEGLTFANLREFAKEAGGVMERAWHRLKYVPPPPRTDQVAKDLAFAELHPTVPNQCPPSTLAAVSAGVAPQPWWPLHPAAVQSSYCKDQIWPPRARKPPSDKIFWVRPCSCPYGESRVMKRRQWSNEHVAPRQPRGEERRSSADLLLSTCKATSTTQVGNVGAVYLAMGDFDSAVDCHTEHLRLAKQLGNKVEEARAYSNLGSSHHYRRSFEQARTFHEHVLRLARELGDRVIEARAYAGLGHAARCMGDSQQARRWHEKQLDMALAARDKVAEGRACSNLGIVYQLAGHFEAALKLHQAHLNIGRSLGDRAGMGRAYGNMGNAQSAMGCYEQAVQLHKQELTISKEVNDRSAEASTHGNLAVAYQALGRHEMALLHYHSHLNIARELKDSAGEACALCNLGNCYSSRGEFGQAVPYYENFMRLSEEVGDVEAQARACHFLGYAHYCLGNYKDAIDYYEKDLTLAKNLHDRVNMGRAYCNLGLSHMALGNLDGALECQKYFLAISQVSRNLQGKFRALGNMGDVLMKMKKSDEAVQMYQRQLLLVRHSKERHLKAAAYGALGLCHRQLKCYDKALGYHTQELTLQQELGDVRGECLAHSRLGAVHLSLGQLGYALRCYQEQLERARELRDCPLETQALGNLGITRLGMAHFEDAIGYFEQQLALLEQLGGSSSTLLDKGRAYGSLGDCYDALGDLEEAVKCHEQYLGISLKAQSPRDQERAYRGLGNSHRCLGNLQQALVCLEKRLVVAHELTAEGAAPGKAAAYGELGALHRQLGNYEQALACLQRQMALAQDDPVLRGDAACGLGAVYQAMGSHDQALHWHQLDLEIAEETHNMAAQGRAYGNLGVTHEALGHYERAVALQEQHLSVAAQLGDKVAKALAYSSLGRVHHALGNVGQAASYLQQGLQTAEQLGRREEEARVRHRLGLVLWLQEDLDGAQHQLHRAQGLLEALGAEARGTPDRRDALGELLAGTSQALQRVLVSLGRPEEALVVAERSRTRAFSEHAHKGSCAYVPTSVEQMLEVVNRQKASVLYYSVAAGRLFTWLLVPHKGVVKFTEASVGGEGRAEAALPDREGQLPVGAPLLERHVAGLREALGVEPDAEEPWQSHWDEAGDRLGQDPERHSTGGFSRLGNRNHLLNSSNYSLSSLFSVGSVSVTSGPASRAGSMRAPRPHWPGPPSLHALYELLIGHSEEELCRCAGRDLLVVPDADLYLVPFAMLRANGSTEYLCERFSLTVLPSLSVLRAGQRAKAARQQHHGHYPSPADRLASLVVGNPRVSRRTLEWLGCAEIPHAEQEAEMVAEILGGEALVGAEATKEAVLGRLSQAECVHLSAHVSWKSQNRGAMLHVLDSQETREKEVTQV
ncbi:tetratricopeptide repeat protein 28 [Ixodes scapularis]